uniref:HDC12197 n=1 Tax=Drosophila melanogaster TaxID=7227 RepID=Q6IKK3_DROME|nr:TPA_inf: HDC12197 [Drosophila melanogaster]
MSEINLTCRCAAYKKMSQTGRQRQTRLTMRRKKGRQQRNRLTNIVAGILCMRRSQTSDGAQKNVPFIFLDYFGYVRGICYPVPGIWYLVTGICLLVDGQTPFQMPQNLSDWRRECATGKGQSRKCDQHKAHASPCRPSANSPFFHPSTHTDADTDRQGLSGLGCPLFRSCWRCFFPALPPPKSPAPQFPTPTLPRWQDP